MGEQAGPCVGDAGLDLGGLSEPSDGPTAGWPPSDEGATSSVPPALALLWEKQESVLLSGEGMGRGPAPAAGGLASYPRRWARGLWAPGGLGQLPFPGHALHDGLVISHGPVHAAAAKAESWRSWKDQKAEWRDQSPHSQFDFSREHCLPWARGTAPGGGFENSRE